MRALAASATLLLLTAQTPLAPQPAATVVATIAGRNAAVKHYTFDVETRIAMLTFPWVRFTMHGTGEYTRGGPYYVRFDDVPWYARGFSTMQMDAIDIANWPRLYTMAVVAQDGDSVTMVLHDAKGSDLK